MKHLVIFLSEKSVCPYDVSIITNYITPFPIHKIVHTLGVINLYGFLLLGLVHLNKKASP